MKKGYRIVIASVIVSILILGIIVTYLYYFQDDDVEKKEDERFTAKEGLEEANEIALNHSLGAKLIGVMWIFTPSIEGELSEDGRYNHWSYDYYVPLENGSYEYIKVYINNDKGANFESIFYNDNVTENIIERSSFNNWPIDSPEAFEIVKSNETFQKYLEVYPKLTSTTIYLSRNATGILRWCISFRTYDEDTYPTFLMEFRIDAMNGNILDISHYEQDELDFDY